MIFSPSRLGMALIALSLSFVSISGVFAQKAEDTSRLRDELLLALRQKDHWSKDVNCTVTVSIKDAFKNAPPPVIPSAPPATTPILPIFSATPALRVPAIRNGAQSTSGPNTTPPVPADKNAASAQGNTQYLNGTVILQFSRLPDNVTVSEVWSLVAVRDDKSRLSLVAQTARQIGQSDFRGLRAPAKNETLQAVYRMLRDSKAVAPSLPWAERTVLVKYVDAFRDASNPVVDISMDVDRSVPAKPAVHFIARIPVQLEYEYFQNAMDTKGGTFLLHAVNWFLVRIVHETDGSWSVVPQAWEPMPEQGKTVVAGQAGSRYKPEVLSLFLNLERDGLDRIWGATKEYQDAIAKAAAFRID